MTKRAERGSNRSSSQSRIVRPASGNSTLGFSKSRRVPLPAAGMTVVQSCCPGAGSVPLRDVQIRCWLQPVSGSKSDSDSKIRSAPACRRGAGSPVVKRATRQPAADAALTPETESSTTRQYSAGTPKAFTVAWKMSGAGLASATSAPVTTAWNSGRAWLRSRNRAAPLAEPLIGRARPETAPKVAPPHPARPS